MKRLMTGLGLLILLTSLVPIYSHADEEDERHQYYYVLVDRFQNSNEVTEEGVNRDDPNAFHGGDLIGLQDRVDHIAELGITDVVLSPLFASEHYTGSPVFNFEQIQSTFGSASDVQDMVQAFHDQDINVIVQVPFNSVSSNSPLRSEDWVNENGEVDLTQDGATDYFIELLQRWGMDYNVDGFYVPGVDQLPQSFIESVTAEVDRFWLGEVSELNNSDIESFIGLGFDRIVNGSFHERATDYFYDIETDSSLLLGSNLKNSEDVVQYMDSYMTDRFTRSMEESGLHPITRWKMALTYMYTTPNEPWLYQGTANPTDGVVEDRSHHDMMNFLAGDEQLNKHIEQLSSINENFDSIQDGNMNVLHDEDDFIVYERVLDDERIIITINNSPGFRHTDLDHIEDNQELRGLIRDDLVRQNDDGSYTVSLERESTNVYNVREDTGANWLLISIFGGVMGIFVVFAIIIYWKNAKER
ncbi:alpha-amylase family glycosyl hydrolase [Alkalibacillus sp. S2W]|uniref:alpha-amylase family glycosyl hydrolase n=1 Tax=Alkalibacillus sp. S2W TaxID=3386553 RepID=UPI00398D39DE